MVSPCILFFWNVGSDGNDVITECDCGRSWAYRIEDTSIFWIVSRIQKHFAWHEREINLRDKVLSPWQYRHSLASTSSTEDGLNVDGVTLTTTRVHRA